MSQPAPKSPDTAGIAAIQRLGLLEAAPVEAFDRITRLAVRLLDVPVALVSLPYEGRLVFASCAGVSESWAREREDSLYSFFRHGPASGKPLIVADAREHPFGEDVRVLQDPGVIAYLGVPLMTSEGQTVGAFCAIGPVLRRWCDQEVTLVAEMARSAMAEVELRAEAAERRRIEGLLVERRHDSEASVRSAQRGKNAEALLDAVAHDLNNPLHVIRNFAEMMLLNDRNEEDRELLEIIRDEADRAAEVVSQLQSGGEPLPEAAGD